MSSMHLPLARVGYSAGLLGLGILGLIHGDYAINWQPIPPGLPSREVFAYVAAVLSIGVAVALWIPRTAANGALVSTAYLALGWMLPQIVKMAPHPEVLAMWLGVCEPLAAASGAWILWRLLAASPTAERSLRVARSVFGIACLVFGAAHWVYADFTAGMIPAWLPQRLPLAYLTGAAHIAAGLALISGIQARLAAILEALMMCGFVLLVHVPSLLDPPAWAPNARMQWTGLLWAMVLAASAWTVAASFDRRNILR
jgi:uncharacterized membrane protein